MLHVPRFERDGFSLVELMVAVAIVGILAAIAIPAFQQYVRRSKTSEAEMFMDEMVDGATNYFQSEQLGCQGASDCAEPWHDSTRKGMPISWSNYVFPGGDVSWDSKGGQSPPVGGSTYRPEPQASQHVSAVTNKLNFDASRDALHFKYVYRASGSGPNASATIRARADFEPSSASHHTYTRTIEVDTSSGTVSASPSTLTNEGE
jgi:prepilin-type N-terminal cleavage/methylation domain-containing protein